MEQTRTQTQTYMNAVAMIRDYAMAKQAELDKKAAEACEAARAEIFAALGEGELAELIRQTSEFPRKQDGYPMLVLTESTREVLKAAQAAGLIRDNNVGQVNFFHHHSFSCANVTPEKNSFSDAIEAAAEARHAALAYHQRQTWMNL